jgi:NitT/TauT family transport system substrate-binding protein
VKQFRIQHAEIEEYPAQGNRALRCQRVLHESAIDNCAQPFYCIPFMPQESFPDTSDVAPGPGLHRRRQLLTGAALMPLLWACTGCAPSKPLVLAGHPWPGYEPMFLARKLGYLPEGITLFEAPTVHASIEAVRSGQVDGAMLTLDEVLQLRDRGKPLEIVLVFDVSRGADVFLARPEIASLHGIKGKRVGVEDSALGTLMLTMVLESAGLTMSDIHVRRIVYEEQEAAFNRGEVDALVTYEPVSNRLKFRGARQLMSTRELPDTVFDVLAVRPDIAEDHAKALRTTLAGHFKALTYLRQNPWDAAYQVAPHMKVSAEEMIASLKGLELPDLIGNRRYLSNVDGQLMRVTQRLSTIMLQAGLINQAVDTRQLFTERYLPGDRS